VLPEIGASRESDLLVEPLPGGVGERSFRLSLGPRRWAVRMAGARPPGALGLAEESEVAAAAAAAELAPAVAGTDPATGVFVTEYLDRARPLTPELARRPATIDRLAAVLRRLHELRIRPRPFEPERFAREYLHGLGGLAALEGARRRRGGELERLAREYSARYPCTALCHNDLVASNVLDDGRLRLIDFEYAVTAAPVLDLAGLAAFNGYAAHERWHLAEAYYAGVAVPFGPAELERVVRLIRLMGYFWALAEARSAADPEPYVRFADEAGAWLN
jgi:thiamine kinase-like enzyme